MPFVQRVVEPKYLSRVTLFNENGTPKVSDGELEAVTNFTLCNALRQLASLSLIADDIFKELGSQLRTVYKRCEVVRTRISLVDEKLAQFDPKKVPVLRKSAHSRLSFPKMKLFSLQFQLCKLTQKTRL
ncbi:hypothetical protein YQE_08494, partial [Dendroctonus ponderosae]